MPLKRLPRSMLRGIIDRNVNLYLHDRCAGHMQYLAADVGGQIGRKENGGHGQCPGASSRDPVGISFLSISTTACLSGALMKLVGDGPGATQLTRMWFLASTVCQLFGENIQGSLGLGIGADAMAEHPGAAGTDIDNGAAALFFHVGQNGCRDMHGAIEVQGPFPFSHSSRG